MSYTNTSNKNYQHLTLEERETIALDLAEGKSQVQIARQLGRSKSTISREVRRNGPQKYKCRYRANRAQLKSDERKKCAHVRERLANDAVKAYVVKHLQNEWSPEQIAGRIPIDLSGHKTNYESIYQFVYQERRDLIPFLRRRHRIRRKRGSAKNKRSIRIPNRTSIDMRPESVNNRKEPGHWETDTAISRASKEALQVSVERKTCFVKIRKLARKSAQCMHEALCDSLLPLKPEMRKTITYDNGKENVKHVETNKVLGTNSYFCTPYHSWEKGSVENTIGLIRQYLQKQTDFSIIPESQIEMIEARLNSRPRKRLGFLTPEEAFANAVALTG